MKNLPRCQIVLMTRITTECSELNYSYFCHENELWRVSHLKTAPFSLNRKSIVSLINNLLDFSQDFITFQPEDSSRLSLKRNCCTCGSTKTTPGKQTCCSQRCPCYTRASGCVSCKCKGCKNTHGANDLGSCSPKLDTKTILSLRKVSF